MNNVNPWLYINNGTTRHDRESALTISFLRRKPPRHSQGQQLSATCLMTPMRRKARGSDRIRLQLAATMKSRSRFVVALLFALLAFLECPQTVSVFLPSIRSAANSVLPTTVLSKHGNKQRKHTTVSLHLFFQSPLASCGI